MASPPTLTGGILSGPTIAYLREIERLEALMPADKHGNISPAQAGLALGMSSRTVRDSMHRFNAADRSGDDATKRANVPCNHTGGFVEDDEGKYGRWTINRAIFIAWLMRGWPVQDVPADEEGGEAA